MLTTKIQKFHSMFLLAEKARWRLLPLKARGLCVKENWKLFGGQVF